MNEMAPFRVEQAVRKATPALIALWGHSGSGKTYSALLIARGLVGPTGKVVVIDTENRRAEFYANVAEPWLHIDFQPPFTPERYRQAMQVAEDAGADVIIIDSGSHVWEGEGGVLDMADASKAKGLQKWNAPKMAYKRMLNALLRSKVHVIFCLRAKEHHVQQKGRDGSTEIIHMGQVPIAEKNFIYEMTVAAKLDAEHKTEMVKAPEDLAGAVSNGILLSAQTGEQIAEWVGGAAIWDSDLQVLRRNAREAATFGTEQAKLHWEGLTKEDQRRLKDMLPELRQVAADADQQQEGADDGENEGPEGNPFDTAPAAAPPDDAPGSCLDDGPDTTADNEPDTKEGEQAEKPQKSAKNSPASNPEAKSNAASDGNGKPEPEGPVDYDKLLAGDVKDGTTEWSAAVKRSIAACETGEDLKLFRSDIAASEKEAFRRARQQYNDVVMALNTRADELEKVEA